MSVYGLEIEEMPEGWTPLEACVVLKCLDDEGEVALATRQTDALRVWDVVGMLEAALEVQRLRLRECFITDEGEEDV